MRILALDLGTRRVGVALSDPLGLTAQGLPTIERRGRKALIEAVRGLVEAHGVEHLVLGLPLNMNGTRGPRAQEALAFAGELGEALGIPVNTWDERMTTVAAKRALAEGRVGRSKRRQLVDRIAAQLILEGYLESIKQAPPRNE